MNSSWLKTFLLGFFLFGLSACDSGLFKNQKKQTREEAYSGKSFDGKSGAEIDWNDYGWFNPGFLDYFFPNLDRWVFDSKPGARLWKYPDLSTPFFIYSDFHFGKVMSEELGVSRLSWLNTGPASIGLTPFEGFDGEKAADIRIYLVLEGEERDWVFTQNFQESTGVQKPLGKNQENLSDTLNWQKNFLEQYQQKISANPLQTCFLFNYGDNYQIEKTLAIIVVSKTEKETQKFSTDTITCSFKAVLFHMGAIYIESAPSYELVFIHDSTIPSLQNKISATPQLMATYYFLVSNVYKAGDSREYVLERSRIFWEGFIEREWEKYQETKK